MIELWGADQTMLSKCGESCNKPENFFFDYFVWLVDTYNDELDIAFMAFLDDPVETREFGISIDTWDAHLRSLRSKTLHGTNASTFYHNSRGHTVINSMYTTKVGDVTVADWLRLVLDHQHHGKQSGDVE